MKKCETHGNLCIFGESISYNVFFVYLRLFFLHIPPFSRLITSKTLFADYVTDFLHFICRSDNRLALVVYRTPDGLFSPSMGITRQNRRFIFPNYRTWIPLRIITLFLIKTSRRNFNSFLLSTFIIWTIGTISSFNPSNIILSSHS